jgi:hypothetical protein
MNPGPAGAATRREPAKQPRMGSGGIRCSVQIVGLQLLLSTPRQASMRESAGASVEAAACALRQPRKLCRFR